jgi:hydroxyacylglutathione hydrolase
MKEQIVCTVCGFNMIGYHPKNCPFCGAPQEKFLTSEECSRQYQVKESQITSKVSQLITIPRLGYEHAAYRIKTGSKVFWIDSPSCFDKKLKPVDTITFTHHHFLGASNLYQEYFHCIVQINQLDGNNALANNFSFDRTFEGDFTDMGLTAYHIDGHTPGFTLYIYDHALFICDYVFSKRDSMRFNPYGSQIKTRNNAQRIWEIAESNNIHIVCDYQHVESYRKWRDKFYNLLQKHD